MKNPFRAVDKFPFRQQPRYVPTENDFWAVYNQAKGQDKVMLFTFLHLAARRKEIFNLKWTDLGFQKIESVYGRKSVWEEAWKSTGSP